MAELCRRLYEIRTVGILLGGRGLAKAASRSVEDRFAVMLPWGDEQMRIADAVAAQTLR